MLKLRKTPGPDNITNEMILHLGRKKKLLQLFNDGWRTGTVPQVWREAIMIPILKRSKHKSKAESYRPIGLTSCVGKLMECLINTRFMWHLEDKKYITPEQAAFKQDRSTEDQITYIAQAIEDAFQDQKHTLAVWIDLEKAFDKVWKEGLKLKLHQCGVAGRMFKWIGQYMHKRKAKVQIKQHLSKKRTLRQGIPQGVLLSPTLFLILIRDILHQMPKNIQGAIYADDFALWCSEEYITTANYRMQQTLQLIRVLDPIMACQSERKENNFHNLQPLQPEVQCATETKWANTTPGRCTYISRRHPGPKTYLEKTAPEEPGYSEDSASLDEKTVMHRVGC